MLTLRTPWLPALMLSLSLAWHPASGQSSKPIVYDFGGTPLIEHGDTLIMPLPKGQADSIRAKLTRRMSADGKTPLPGRIDTLVYLLRHDSVYIVFSGKRYPLHPELAKNVRFMRYVARRDAANPPMKPTVI